VRFIAWCLSVNKPDYRFSPRWQLSQPSITPCHAG
jgi:hypothetical protein